MSHALSTESHWDSFCTFDDTGQVGNAPLAYAGDTHCPRPDDRRRGQVDLARLHGGLPRSTDYVRLGVSTTADSAVGRATVILDVGQIREIVEQLSGWLQGNGWPAPMCSVCTPGGADRWTMLAMPSAPTPVGAPQ